MSSLFHLMLKVDISFITKHFSDGIGRTGTFCALNTCIESVKLENTFDVFTVVRLLRIQRPGMVQTLVSIRAFERRFNYV